MDIQQVRVKVMARDGQFEQAGLIPIFHRWIQESRLDEQLLIDVADYSHVPSGPGVMLIAHEGHYAFDSGGGRVGLAYGRKRDSIGPARPRLVEAMKAAFVASEALEQEPSLGGRLRFEPGRLEIHIMSRLVAPNTVATHEAFQPDLLDLLQGIYSSDEIAIAHQDGPKQPFGVSVEVSGAHAFRDLIARIPSQ